MPHLELRDSEAARRLVLAGLALQQAPPTAPLLRPALEWCLEILQAGQPLPPPGFVADLGRLLWFEEATVAVPRPAVPGWPPGLSRAYEDHVLGHAYAYASFVRAADALRRYQGRDRARGLAFLVGQFRERADFDGVFLSPGVVKALLAESPVHLLPRTHESLATGDALPHLVQLYESLVAKSRQVGALLAPEDVFELEHRTALEDLGERVALRQVLQVASQLEADLPRHRPRATGPRREVATRLLEEDAYPVGGFTSLSTRGSMESLLHSQLAYMERAERPDLFDIKYLRDELLYYARDENQFFRRRTTLVFALFPDLAAARFKDVALPWQRIVLLLGLLVAAVRRLADWLQGDALTVEFCSVSAADPGPLDPERHLLERVFGEQVANGTVRFTAVPLDRLARHCARLAERSLCHVLLLSTSEVAWADDAPPADRLRLDGPVPALGLGREVPAVPEADDPVAAWGEVLRRLLPAWLT